MQFMAVHEHFVRWISQRHRFQVGVDVLLPEAEPGEDVARHMNGVRG